MSKKYKAGDVILLNWEGEPDEYYVRGHMRPEVAQAILEKEYDGPVDWGIPYPAYGHWSVGRSWYDGRPCQILETYDLPGRGRFPIMIADRVAYRTNRREPAV